MHTSLRMLNFAQRSNTATCLTTAYTIVANGKTMTQRETCTRM